MIDNPPTPAQVGRMLRNRLQQAAARDGVTMEESFRRLEVCERWTWRLLRGEHKGRQPPGWIILLLAEFIRDEGISLDLSGPYPGASFAGAVGAAARNLHARRGGGRQNGARATACRHLGLSPATYSLYSGSRLRPGSLRTLLRLWAIADRVGLELGEIRGVAAAVPIDEKEKR